MDGEVTPQGARNSALKNVAPVSRTVRRTSDSTSIRGSAVRVSVGKVFWTVCKNAPCLTSLVWQLPTVTSAWTRAGRIVVDELVNRNEDPMEHVGILGTGRMGVRPALLLAHAGNKVVLGSRTPA